MVSVNCPVSSTTQYMSWGELIVYDGHVCRCVLIWNHKQLNFHQLKTKGFGKFKVYKPATTIDNVLWGKPESQEKYIEQITLIGTRCTVRV